jgi:hypothetical protein
VRRLDGVYPILRNFESVNLAMKGALNAAEWAFLGGIDASPPTGQQVVTAAEAQLPLRGALQHSSVFARSSGGQIKALCMERLSLKSPLVCLRTTVAHVPLRASVRTFNIGNVYYL